MQRGRLNIGKFGQFYLISAIILATIIIGIGAVSNYTKKNTNIKLDSLKEELQIESSEVLDFGTNSGFSNVEMNELLINFIQKYIDSESRENNFYFVFGNENNITVKGYQKQNRIVSVTSGISSIITDKSGEFVGGINPSENETILNIEDNSYTFKIEKGENFYFVLSQENNGGEYIVRG